MGENKNKFFSGLTKILDENAPTLATFGSILGVVATVFFMHKGAKQAAAVEEKYAERVEEIEEDYADDEAQMKEELAHARMTKNMRLLYIYRWAIVSGIASGGFAILSNYLNGRAIAALTTMLALNQDKLKKATEKAKQMIGEDKLKEIQESVQKDILGEHITKGEIKAEKSKKVRKLPDGEPDGDRVRFYLPSTDEFWDIQRSQLQDAIDEATRMQFLTWNDFRNMCGYDSCGWNVKWDKGNPFKAHIGYVNVGVPGMDALIFDNVPHEADTYRFRRLQEEGWLETIGMWADKRSKN